MYINNYVLCFVRANEHDHDDDLGLLQYGRLGIPIQLMVDGLRE